MQNFSKHDQARKAKEDPANQTMGVRTGRRWPTAAARMEKQKQKGATGEGVARRAVVQIARPCNTPFLLMVVSSYLLYVFFVAKALALSVAGRARWYIYIYIYVFVRIAAMCFLIMRGHVPLRCRAFFYCENLTTCEVLFAASTEGSLAFLGAVGCALGLQPFRNVRFAFTSI